MKRLFTLMAVLVAAVFAYGDTVEFDFSTSIPSPWTSSVAPNSYETADPARGTQWTATTALKLADVKNVTSVTIICSSNTTKNTIAVSVAGKTWGTETLAKEAHVEKVFTGSAASGDLVIDITRAEKSVYIEKIVVTGDVDGGNGGGEEGDDKTDLDPNYTYAEPTVVLPTGAVGSNQAYTFIQNNIQVSATVGGQTETYFGCNAGQSITFTATQPIQAVVINGYVKKDFAATADHGTIQYVDASEDLVEADPVVIVTDVMSKTVTLACEKQMRCYQVEFYFVSNPDVEIEGGFGGGDDDEYTFDYEPDETSKLNITFAEAQYADYSELFGYNYTDIYFVDEDYEMEMAVFAPSVPGTVLAPGTYAITDTYEDGTVQASPGGDDYYDYPAYIATGFQYDEDYEEWYYTTSYYLVSGTLKVEPSAKGVKMTIDATTAKGSTVHAVFEGKIANAAGDEDAIEQTTQDRKTDGKFLRDGRLYIRQGDRVFDARGIQVK